MCRLYGFRANESTRVECSLVHAQNALMAQSKGDREGQVHGHGWGIAENPNGVPFVEKQAWAAHDGEQFTKSAARVYARTVIAHVRRATVGPPAIENTHPFVHGRWLFAHNGTVPNFEAVRMRVVEAMDPLHRDDIKGSTDSEHIFRYLLTLWAQAPARPLEQTLRQGLNQVIAWSREVDPDAAIGLNVLFTNGEMFVGSRLGRTLWFLERDAIQRCSICGRVHVHHEPKQDYRAVEIASEPITDEDWRPVPDGTVYAVDPDLRLRIEPLTG